MSASDRAALADLVIDAARDGSLPVDLDDLRAVLYRWYLNTETLSSKTGPLRAADLNLAGALDAAHAGRSTFSGGWTAEQVSTWGRVVASRGETNRIVNRHEYRVLGRAGLRAQPGDSLLVSAAWTWIDEASGYWMTRAGPWPPANTDRLARVYWNVDPRRAPDLVAHLTGVLRAEHVESFMIKTPASPVHIGRADALVLYTAPLTFENVRARLVDVGDIALRTRVPRFTQTLMSGVGYAEGALDGDSFGDSICAALAPAIAERHPELATADREQLADVLAAELRNAGYDPARPHLLPAAP